MMIMITEQHCQCKLPSIFKSQLFIRQNLSYVFIKKNLGDMVERSGQLQEKLCIGETVKDFLSRYKDPGDGFVYVQYSNTIPNNLDKIELTILSIFIIVLQLQHYY